MYWRFYDVVHSGLKTLLFSKSFPSQPSILAETDLLEFDHSVFRSHW